MAGNNKPGVVNVIIVLILNNRVTKCDDNKLFYQATNK
ncbi:hypothetical protein PPEP_a0121 [Pseudoalteromonas peptidolytica F12-50-A1]|uniref:Uncharacterized protein n=1 Tax=Pseudoalteromonas peptidolytica F12-50-A1 TaxID=1315280 RepID=A0A8I0T2U1_9GAMM|nr:hypothetical protein [Pseudoalteromonas peptidolytica F12-50-A1]